VDRAAVVRAGLRTKVYFLGFVVQKLKFLNNAIENRGKENEKDE
jgi:hypothetical protein